MTHDYAARVRALEAEGMTTSDAQGVADAEGIEPTRRIESPGWGQPDRVTDSDSWQAESAAAFRRDPAYSDPRTGICAVCGTPVLADHEPTRVLMGDGQPGVIHGAFPCLDVARCEAHHILSGLQCLLPEQHTGGHYMGAPIE